MCSRGGLLCCNRALLEWTDKYCWGHEPIYEHNGREWTKEEYSGFWNREHFPFCWRISSVFLAPPNVTDPSVTLARKIDPGVTFGLHLYADTLDCIISFSSYLLTPKPMYDMISRLSCVRYNLMSFLCTIRSHVFLVYDTISRLSCVWYNLTSFLCTIRSHVFLVYDTISRLSHVRYNLTVPSCTISILEPPLLRYLVLGEFRSLST